MVNSLWSILTGERIGHEDDRVKEIVAGTDQFIKNETLAGPLMIFPWLRHFPFIAAKFRESKSHPMKMRQLQVSENNQFGDFVLLNLDISLFLGFISEKLFLVIFL